MKCDKLNLVAKQLFVYLFCFFILFFSIAKARSRYDL